MHRLLSERAATSLAASAVLSLALVTASTPCPQHAHAQAVGGLMVSKSIPAATIAVIDPESGTSTGGSVGTDLRLAPGDVILFELNYFAMPDGVARGLAGYLTEYIPANTEVIGVRLIDAAGRTILPHPPGATQDGCPAGGCTNFSALPCTAGAGCVAGTRSVGGGSLAQLYADTGIFYATDLRTRRRPDTTFITYANGFRLWEEPISAANVAPILGISAPFFAHAAWDVDQIVAYGISNSQGNASGNQGNGNTPYGYGSPVAGPMTHYSYEATDTVADPTLASWNTTDPNDWAGIRFNNVVGPWQRVQYPGSLIGTGAAVSGTGPVTRRTLDASTMGFDLRPANPLPVAANAVRVSLGELRAGETGTVEIALRVLDTPLDPVQMADVDCAEMFGGANTSTSPGGGGGADNPWGFVIPSPACVFLNNQFDLTVDRTMATGGQTLTYTLHGKNLSTLAQTGVVVSQDYDGARVAFVSATGAPVSTTCSGRPCVQWTLGTLDPGEEYTFTTTFTVGGTGQISVVSYANYRSTQLPAPGFTTQALTLVRATPVLQATLAPVAASVAVGGTITLTGTLTNSGTNQANMDSLAVVLPGATWTLVPNSITVSGTVYPATQTGNTIEVNLGGLNLTAGASRPISMIVRVPAGTASPSLQRVDLFAWASSTGYGGAFETYFADITRIPVGAPRSARPVLDCPILSNATRIGGATSEADGTDVRAYLNGIERGIDTNATALRFDVGTFGPATTFGRLYGGLEVTATATAPGEQESLPSDPCFVTHVAACSDGLDNDGDGAVDFPIDPGCSSPTDNDERNVQCSDGIDNDLDGLIDWPADFECSSADDATEAGTPACGNGVDDDGDGAIDFPADTGCTAATDRDEVDRRRCSDGIDNDLDGRIDFGTGGTNDPGCHAANDDDETNFTYAAGDVRARLLLVFDTSGSMNWNVCADDFTGGDGSTECAGTDVTCATCAEGGCGNGVADDSRISLARAGVTDVVAGYGDVELGLMRFHQRATAFQCPGTNATAQSGGWAGAGAVCGSFASGDLLVGFGPDNEYSLLEWTDGADNYTGAPPAGLDTELRGSGTTPIAGSLDSARTYLSGVRAADAQASCRPYDVVLLTDGAETCGGDPIASASALQAAGYRVHVIGFATQPAMAAQLNSIAAAGGTTAAIFANDSVELSSAISDIINDSILIETCNGVDDNCNGLIDEGFTLYCNRPTVPTASLCVDPGETRCDGIDDNCNGGIDEGLRNACGTCGAAPVEVCDGVDNDCDGVIDEGNVCAGCVPSTEICDGLDNDCDGLFDESLTRGCGTDLGACVAGSQSCSAGAWSVCTGVGPVAETCNGVDDDCDGVIDGLSRSCGSAVGTCVPGTQTCTAGAWAAACTGAIGPGTEICDGRDNDCDASTDEGNPGGGATCGTSTGECTAGTLSCVAGALSCVGGTSAIAETCNALDDDCDGATDEGVPTMGACGTAVGECDPGILTCSAGTFTCIGARGAVAEVCNGLDDDCDGSADEGNPGSGASCGESTGACAFGTFQCTLGALVCTGGIGPVAETCNTIDDDCDGLVDEGNPGGGGTCGTNTGECVAGTQTCTAGALVCTGGVDAVSETCNGLDDDCDGSTDELNPGGGAACGTATGACVAGAMTCTGGTLVCTGGTGPATETCNGLDDDCDGSTDELNPGGGAACGSAVGACMRGTLACTAGALTCTGGVGPLAETCNAIDDNCDGLVDEGNPGGGASCGSSIGTCRAGTQTCTAGALACSGDVGPRAEICDGLDNDCDGTTDEGNPGGGASCGSAIGACTPGALTCTGGGLVCTGGILPAAEACNTIDDDCNGAVDDAIASPGSCGASTGECDLGLQRCVGGVFVCTGDVGPVTEICDGRDNDCDGETDEGNPGGGVACGTSTGECAPGLSECIAGALVCTGGTPPAVELCNGLDDDCNGLVDEGNPGGGASCGLSDVGECEFGALACSAGALVCVGETGPTPERCNGLDDDCDGVIDNGDPEAGATCGDGTGECSPGTTACVAGVLTCAGGTGPTVEICNALDDDCDGVADEGISVGAPCGSDVGECSPGVFVCRDGGLICDGAITPAPEVCDTLDNDCNGVVDDNIALGAMCGTDEGTCEAGAIQCIAGREICVGEILPTPEGCDCADNDCDGTVDEPPTTGTLCGDTARCVTASCQCAPPCVVTEFGPQCPSGRVPVYDGALCDCIISACDATACAMETHDSPATSAPACAPDTSGLPSCICRSNACTFPCEGVVCGDGTVCDPRSATGACVPDNCLGLGCPEGEVCDHATGACTTDPCVAAACDATEACRDGTCEPSCATTPCPAGELCTAGTCAADRCLAASCLPSQFCNPADGSCATDLCVTGGVRCGPGTVCVPLTGMCTEDPCARLRCPAEQLCVGGECVPEMLPVPDGGVDGGADGGAMSMDLGPVDAGPTYTRVLASGGGGCVCTVPGAVHATPRSGTAGWLALFALAGLACFARRRRRARSASIARSASASSIASKGAILAGALALVSSGCDVDPYCIDCPTDELDGSTGDMGGDADFGVSDLGPDLGPVDGGPPDLGLPDGCVPGAPELCNVYDDDCDGEIDEGIDTTRDPFNCGACGTVCFPPHAFPSCEASVCGFTDCDFGWHDLNGDSADGCEYRCSPSAPDDTLCDLRDNDCDGLTDEDVAFDTDPVNCGTCGHDCRFARATATCTAGTCSLGACEPNFYDIDAVLANGCEYACTPADPATESCNGRDDDCDRMIDEEDPGGGGACGSAVGACMPGVEACVGGAITCTGGVSPSTETCNGIDDDCDGTVDQGNPEGGRLCGPGVGACTQGREICTAGALVCTGAVGPAAETCNGLDDDCDGTIDDGNPDGGGSCGTDVGICVAGAFACRGGVVVCEGSAGALSEVCNGLDDDCDGSTDEDNPGGGTFCGTSVGECTPGSTACMGGAIVCVGGTSAGTETCNALDDDCDGSVDEGDPDSGGACGDETGACAAGILHCRAGSLLCEGALGPAAETCNGIDDDCDGTTDEGDPGGGGSCGSDIGACIAGVRMCSGGTLICTGGTTAGVETCNGIDDDCDGSTDEGNPGGGASCGTTTGECAAGTQTCVSGTVQCLGNVGPTTELCDGLDNDCDGVTDQGNPGGGAACGTATGVCETGVLTCTAGAFTCVGGVGPTAELCNLLDDDCDGATDESIVSPGPCGSGVGYCRQGSQLCVAGAFTCVGGRGAQAEACDLVDNDCDGMTDEGNPGGGASCGTSTGECSSGTVTCTAGALACVGGSGATAELCNGLDDDCDGLTDEGNPGGGTSCGSDVGECSTGTNVCTAGALVCTGAVGPGSESCNGRDDNCNGAVDEGNPGGGALCGTDNGACMRGTQTCTGGVLVCSGGVVPTFETCNELDDDCDLVIDNGFDKTTSIVNCGSCGNACAYANGVASCGAGVCALAGCLAGFVNLDGLPANGCEYACSFNGAEACNGRDDDCDGMTDEGLTVPSNFCNANGVCAGTPATCGGALGWRCTYPASFEALETRCDGLDNDCDGAIDEPYPLRGTACGVGTGACRVNGTYVCNGAQNAVVCTAVTPLPAAPSELCNGLDDDCDGATDEGIPLANMSTVTVNTAAGGTMRIMQYEASRPDASALAAGAASNVACSRANVVPWTNVTWPEAAAACTALNTAGVTGWRLCDALDWQEACEGPLAPVASHCLYSYAGAPLPEVCRTSSPLTCNGDEFDSDPGTAGDQNALYTTGSATFPSCGTNWAGGVVRDLSGNAKEWTNTAPSAGVHTIRGGGYNNVELGRMCAFDFTVGSDTFRFANTGFRCCNY